VSEGGEGVVNRANRPFGAGGVCSRVLESQLFPWLARWASVVASGKTALEELDFSHAARVAGSTGQASGVFSVSFVILSWFMDALRKRSEIR